MRCSSLWQQAALAASTAASGEGWRAESWEKKTKTAIEAPLGKATVTGSFTFALLSLSCSLQTVLLGDLAGFKSVKEVMAPHSRNDLTEGGIMHDTQSWMYIILGSSPNLSKVSRIMGAILGEGIGKLILS